MATDTHEFLVFAHRLADAAGEVLRRYFRMPCTPEVKGDSSPVTVADREAEAAMRALIEAYYPAHGIFGEEGERIRSDARLQWVLDPLDGTRSFIAGYHSFTTLIALTENGVPLLGVIDQPILRERWAAGSTALLNDRPVRTRQAARLEDIAIASTSHAYFTTAQAQAYRRLCDHTVSASLGGDAYAYAMLASGHLGAVVDVAMKPYDYCALAPVVQGAGGVITDWKGRPLTLDSDGTVAAACTPQVHAQIMELLRDA